MNVYLELFLTFFQIGALSFGGGYAMIPVMKEKCLQLLWLSEEGLMNFIAVAESTPGPIAINMATFIGASQGGFLGSLCATLGVVLPSFIIILLVASLINNLLNFAGVQAALGGVKPVVVGLILSTGLTMLTTVLVGFSKIGDAFAIDWRSWVILALIVTVGAIYKRYAKKQISPIVLILISAGMGVALFSF